MAFLTVNESQRQYAKKLGGDRRYSQLAMSDIFISYSTDDRPRAKLLAETLAHDGWSVWWDRDITPGKPFDEVIESALAASRQVVVLWTSTSVASQWVRAEAGEALNRDILMPVLLEDVQIPLVFRQIQAASLVGWQGEAGHPGVPQLLAALRERLSGRPVPATPEIGQAPADPKSQPAAASNDTPPAELREKTLGAVSVEELRAAHEQLQAFIAEHPESAQALALGRRVEHAFRVVGDDRESLPPPVSTTRTREPLPLGKWAAATIVGITLVVGAGVWWQPQPPRERFGDPKVIAAAEPAEQTIQIAKRGGEVALQVEGERSGSGTSQKPPRHAAAERGEMVATLLGEAEQAMGASRLSTPPGNNALEYYRRVLALESENANAKSGMRRIVSRYIAFAKKAQSREDFAKAAEYLRRANAVEVARDRVERAREGLARAEHEHAAKISPAVSVTDEAPAKMEAQEEPPSVAIDALVPTASGQTSGPISEADAQTRSVQRGTSSTAPAQVAILGFRTSANCYLPRARELRETVVALVRDSSALTLAYSYHTDAKRHPGLADLGALWSGTATRKKPNVERVYALGQALDFDGAILAWIRCTDNVNLSDDNFKFEIYFFDIALRETYSRVDVLLNMKRGASRVVSDFGRGRRQRRVGQ